MEYSFPIEGGVAKVTLMTDKHGDPVVKSTASGAAMVFAKVSIAEEAVEKIERRTTGRKEWVHTESYYPLLGNELGERRRIHFTHEDKRAIGKVFDLKPEKVKGWTQWPFRSLIFQDGSVTTYLRDDLEVKCECCKGSVNWVTGSCKCGSTEPGWNSQSRVAYSMIPAVEIAVRLALKIKPLGRESSPSCANCRFCAIRAYTQNGDDPSARCLKGMKDPMIWSQHLNEDYPEYNWASFAALLPAYKEDTLVGLSHPVNSAAHSPFKGIGFSQYVEHGHRAGYEISSLYKEGRLVESYRLFAKEMEQDSKEDMESIFRGYLLPRELEFLVEENEVGVSYACSSDFNPSSYTVSILEDMPDWEVQQLIGVSLREVEEDSVPDWERIEEEIAPMLHPLYLKVLREECLTKDEYMKYPSVAKAMQYFMQPEPGLELHVRGTASQIMEEAYEEGVCLEHRWKDGGNRAKGLISTITENAMLCDTSFYKGMWKEVATVKSGYAEGGESDFITTGEVDFINE